MVFYCRVSGGSFFIFSICPATKYAFSFASCREVRSLSQAVIMSSSVPGVSIASLILAAGSAESTWSNSQKWRKENSLRIEGGKMDHFQALHILACINPVAVFPAFRSKQSIQLPVTERIYGYLKILRRLLSCKGKRGIGRTFAVPRDNVLCYPYSFFRIFYFSADLSDILCCLFCGSFVLARSRGFYDIHCLCGGRFEEPLLSGQHGPA